MKIVLRLAPAFLRRFDEYLRVRHPWFWVTRLPANLYIAVIIIPIVCLISLIIPIKNNAFEMFENSKFINLLFFLVIAWLVLSFRQLSLYNLDKSHGKQGAYREFLILLTYWFTFLLPFSLPAIATSIIEYRVSSSLIAGGISWKVALIISFSIAVLFNMFKQVNAKQFFLNFAVCGGILFILGNLTIFFSEANVFVHGLVYIFLGVLIFVIVMYNTPHYNALLHQGIVFLNIMFPILGIIMLLYADQALGLLSQPFSDVFGDNNFNAAGSPEFNGVSVFKKVYENIWEITLWGSIFLHLFLWNSLFKKAYLRLWNLPRPR
jgi:hypothetical protein